MKEKKPHGPVLAIRGIRKGAKIAERGGDIPIELVKEKLASQKRNYDLPRGKVGGSGGKCDPRGLGEKKVKRAGVPGPDRLKKGEKDPENVRNQKLRRGGATGEVEEEEGESILRCFAEGLDRDVGSGGGGGLTSSGAGKRVEGTPMKKKKETSLNARGKSIGS